MNQNLLFWLTSHSVTKTRKYPKSSKVSTKKVYGFRIIWKTNKVRQLVPLTKGNPYPSCQICEAVCSCKANYIGETKQNVITCWNEHENSNKDSELAKYLFNTLIMFWCQHLWVIAKEKTWRHSLKQWNIQPWINKKLKETNVV